MYTDIDAILAKSTLPWWEWDIRRNAVSSNRLKVEMLGYDYRDFLDCDYRRYTDLLHPDDLQRSLDAMYRVLRRETDLYYIDYRIRNSRGEYQWYIDRGYVTAKDDNGDPTLIRGIVLNAGMDHGRRNIENILGVVVRQAQAVNLITLCAHCKMIKVSAHAWEALPADSIPLLDAELSHTVCPACVRLLYPDIAEAIL